MNLLNDLESDIRQMLHLSNKIGEYHQMILHHADVNDKRNYNFEKCIRVKKESEVLQEQLALLKSKWFGN